MLFTKESDYAIRVIRALKSGGKFTVKEICGAEDIPEAFAYKILRKLQKAGIIEIIRGVQGGYVLAKKTDKLSLYDIITAIDPEFAVTQCMLKSCSRNSPGSPCKVHRELLSVQNKIINELKSKNLKEILD